MSSERECEVRVAEVGGAEELGIDIAKLEIPDSEELHTNGKPFDLRVRRVGLTYPKCDLDPKVAAAQLMKVNGTIGLRCAREQHADGTPHLHVFLQRKQHQVKDGREFDLQGENKSFHPNIKKLKTALHAVHWHFYLEKESTPVVCGTYKMPSLGGKKTKLTQEAILDTASREGIDAALHRCIKEGDVKLDRITQVEGGLERMLRPAKRPRWAELIKIAQPIILRNWQKEVLAMLNEPPQKRRILWIEGPPECGKTTFSNYIKTEFKDVLMCGQKCKLDDILFMYDTHQIVCFDYPLAFPWAEMSKAVGAVLEKMSEFGAEMCSAKYKGKEIQLMCHCLVFSNREPIDEIQHRDVKRWNLNAMTPMQRNATS